MKRDAETAIANRFREIIIDLLDVQHDRVTLTSRFREDLEADSLDLVEIIMAVEDEFGLEIMDEDAQEMVTVGDVVGFVAKKING
jgi:acyl carrier protein